MNNTGLKQIVFIILVKELHCLDNGVARLPPMGWMSWGHYRCGVNCDDNPELCLNEDLIVTVANEFYHSGYQEAGYEYIIIDDCWSEKWRDEHGRLVPDQKRFPKGIKYLADYIHKLGLKFGIYGNAGKYTCEGYPGSKDYLEIDAKTFAEWEVDYVKFDGCFVGKEDLDTVYIKFGHQLNETGRPIVYSCSWPYYYEFIHKTIPDYKTIGKYCNLWRNYHDIFVKWDSVYYIIKHYEKNFHRMATYMAPGRWNDPDMIIVGNGALTKGQSRIQMAAWSMLSAPLLISCDMTKVSPFERKLLQNPHVISVDQDSLALQAIPYTTNDPQVTLWVKKQIPRKGDKYNSYSMAILNLGKSVAKVKASLLQYDFDNPDGYTMMDLFSDKYLRNVTLTDSITIKVQLEDVKFYKFFPL